MATLMSSARDSYRRWWVLTLAVMNALYGSAYVLGGVAATPSLQLMARVVPMRWWGAALVLVGVLFFARQHLYAGVLGAAIWAMFAITSAITLVQGTTPAAGGVFLVAGVTVLHLLVSWGVLAGYATDGER